MAPAAARGGRAADALLPLPRSRLGVLLVSAGLPLMVALLHNVVLAAALLHNVMAAVLLASATTLLD